MKKFKVNHSFNLDYGDDNIDTLDTLIKIYEKNITVNSVKLILSNGEEEDIEDLATNQEIFVVVDEYGGHDRDFYDYDDAEEYKSYLKKQYEKEFNY